jgi:hypothetical protein
MLTWMLRLVLLLAVALFTFPAVAGAQHTTAPPGNSGVQEYVETVPSSDGDRPAVNPSGGGLSARERQQLEQAGTAGADAATVLDRTAPEKADSSGKGGANGSSTDSGKPGQGTVLPLLIAATLGIALGAAVARRRRSS